jgi:hypothetical protein
MREGESRSGVMRPASREQRNLLTLRVMRLATLGHRRALRELDRFTDAQCQAFIRAANRDVRFSSARVVACGCAGLLTFVIAMAGAVACYDSLKGSVAWLDDDAMFDRVMGYMLIPALLLAMGVIGATWEFSLRRQIRRVIRRWGRCVACGYALAGLPSENQRKVRCPECGQMNAATPDV